MCAAVQPDALTRSCGSRVWRGRRPVRSHQNPPSRLWTTASCAACVTTTVSGLTGFAFATAATPARDACCTIALSATRPPLCCSICMSEKPARPTCLSPSSQVGILTTSHLAILDANHWLTQITWRFSGMSVDAACFQSLGKDKTRSPAIAEKADRRLLRLFNYSEVIHRFY